MQKTKLAVGQKIWLLEGWFNENPAVTLYRVLFIEIDEDKEGWMASVVSDETNKIGPIITDEMEWWPEDQEDKAIECIIERLRFKSAKYEQLANEFEKEQQIQRELAANGRIKNNMS